MSLSSHRKHKIYIAATMGYGLGSEDPEELALYEMIKKEIEKDCKNRNMGIKRIDYLSFQKVSKDRVGI